VVDNGDGWLWTTADGYRRWRIKGGSSMAEGGSGVDGSKWQRRNKNECGAVVTNSFFCPGFAHGILFFARGFARGSRQNKSLTNKIRADLPAGKKKGFQLKSKVITKK
jgi:hypothetical protein